MGPPDPTVLPPRSPLHLDYGPHPTYLAAENEGLILDCEGVHAAIYLLSTIQKGVKTH